MATKLQPVSIDGQTVWVEVDEIEVLAADGTRSKTVKTASGASAAAEALMEIDIARTLSAVLQPVHAALAAIRPEEVTVELALGLKGEVGIFVAKSEANASLKISAKWKFAAVKPG